ncbi:hypothetical protein P7K49_005953 [Saguinus oedipus]|uniref:RBD domain-containing protein n=1 Tax=Saguinus oedipus TaxID=9490 RepID=A0ABQ9W4L4_SAGOE|nr:hypothetical protein P7K49_005953 [Saguinus oedipus]
MEERPSRDTHLHVCGVATHPLHANGGLCRRESEGSVSSSGSLDLSEACRTLAPEKDKATKHCCIHLPDGTSCVVAVKAGFSIKEILSGLCERHGINGAAADLFLVGGDKVLTRLTFMLPLGHGLPTACPSALPESSRCPSSAPHVSSAWGGGRPLVLHQDSSILESRDLRLEKRTLFRLDLVPINRSVGLKAKPTKPVTEVLRPVVAKYGLDLGGLLVRLAKMRNQPALECPRPPANGIGQRRADGPAPLHLLGMGTVRLVQVHDHIFQNAADVYSLRHYVVNGVRKESPAWGGDSRHRVGHERQGELGLTGEFLGPLCPRMWWRKRNLGHLLCFAPRAHHTCPVNQPLQELRASPAWRWTAAVPLTDRFGEKEPLDLGAPISSLDGQRVVLEEKDPSRGKGE